MGLYDAMKDAVSLAQKADNIELYRQLLDLSAQALELQADVTRLREENVELKRVHDLESDIEYYEIYLKLLELTEPPERGIRVNCNIRKSFVGSVEKGNFKISPILNYRNSFVPTFTGSISETETESVINIYARPQIFARIFMTIWMAFLGLILLVGILRIIMDGFQSFLIMPFILIVFGYGLSSILFWREEQKARQILEKAFHQT